METFQPKFILCPTDFRDPATLALHYGKHLADCYDSRLIILYVDRFSPPPYFTSGQLEDLVKSMERLKGAAHEHLIRYVREQIGESDGVETTVVENETVTAIMDVCRQRKVDLIVMGTHGGADFNHFLLGSVTERVLHQADCPVLTVRGKKDLSEPFKIRIRQILCPVNFTEVSFKALEHAVAISKCFGAKLLVLHVIESRDVAEQSEHSRLCAWIPDEARARCSVKEIIRRGDAAEQIIEMTSSSACDIIVLGAQHKRFHDTTVLGSTTIRVTRHAPCPVLTVIRK